MPFSPCEVSFHKMNNKVRGVLLSIDKSLNAGSTNQASSSRSPCQKQVCSLLCVRWQGPFCHVTRHLVTIHPPPSHFYTFPVCTCRLSGISALICLIQFRTQWQWLPTLSPPHVREVFWMLPSPVHWNARRSGNRILAHCYQRQIGKGE